MNYEDAFNGGCNSPQFGSPFGQLTAPVLCGVSGWYLADDNVTRDTDWFQVQVPAIGVLEISGDAERPCYMCELGPQDCDAVDVLQYTTIGDCDEGSLTITGAPGSLAWFWIGPNTFSVPGVKRCMRSTTCCGPTWTRWLQRCIAGRQ